MLIKPFLNLMAKKPFLEKHPVNLQSIYYQSVYRLKY